MALDTTAIVTLGFYPSNSAELSVRIFTEGYVGTVSHVSPSGGTSLSWLGLNLWINK